MANTFLTDPTLPDTGQLVTGLELASAPVADLYALHNHNIAYAAARVLWAQSWPEGMVIDDVAIGASLTFTVRVPYTPHRKGRWQLSLDMEMTGAGPTTVRCQGTLFQADVIVTVAAGRKWYSGLSIPGLVGVNDYEEVSLKRIAGDGILYGVVLELLPDASPLSAGAGGGEPIGAAQAGAEYPLTASIGVAMIETLDTLAALPRVLSVWAAGFGGGKYPGYSQPYAHGGWGYRHVGRGSYTYMVTGWLFNGSATQAKTLRVGNAEFVVPAAHFGWYTATTVVYDSQSARTVPMTPGAEGLEELLGCGWCGSDASGEAVQDDTIVESDPELYIYSLSVWGA